MLHVLFRRLVFSEQKDNFSNQILIIRLPEIELRAIKANKNPHVLLIYTFIASCQIHYKVLNNLSDQGWTRKKVSAGAGLAVDSTRSPISLTDFDLSKRESLANILRSTDVFRPSAWHAAATGRGGTWPSDPLWGPTYSTPVGPWQSPSGDKVWLFR